MSHRFEDEHYHRQNGMLYKFAARFVVEGRAVTWWADVRRSGRVWSLCGGGIELPEEDVETGLGLTAREIVRHDVRRAIDAI